MSRKVDLDMACRFLKALAPSAGKFTFQTFADQKNLKVRRVVNSAANYALYKGDANAKLRYEKADPLAKIKFESLADIADALVQRNRVGAGIFVAINEMDGDGRRLENFKRFRAVWADMDAEKCKTTTPKWPLKPSIVVASNGGANRHFYWLLDGEIEEATWKGIGARLVEKYGADRNATDLVRVLRVPGFYHCKGEPAMVKLLDCNGRRYTAAELAEAFKPIKRRGKKRTSRPANGDGSVDVGALQSALGHLVGISHPKAKHSETYADDYDTWIRFGHAIKRGLGDDGFSVWDEWAQTSSRYPGEAESRSKWDSFAVEGWNASDPITVGTIFACAKRHGWSLLGFRTKCAFANGLAALQAERSAA
jgi:Primase C terminal 2 (PriCT-2)/RepB DNA-primase N-terminal domain